MWETRTPVYAEDKSLGYVPALPPFLAAFLEFHYGLLRHRGPKWPTNEVLANFCYTELVILDFAGRVVSVTTTELCCYNVKASRDCL